MSPAPSPQIVDDPRYEQAYAKALAKNGLAPELGEPVRRLVTGEADPRSFVCCDSGCHPCMKDYLRAAEFVLKAVDDGAGGGAPRPWWAFWRKG